MQSISRDEFIRSLWLAGFEYAGDAVHAQRFVRPSDNCEVIVPMREFVAADWAEARLRGEVDKRAGATYVSPCCEAESKLRRIIGNLMLLRCTVCLELWERELGARPTLRVVE